MHKTRREKEQQTQKDFHQETPPQFLTGLWAQCWAALLLVSLLAILVYSNTFSVSFHWDDFQNIVESLQIRNISSIPLSESRYVGFLSFALNYRIGQLNVFGYHLVNLLIHITNGCLVYVLVSLLLRISQPPLTPHPTRLTKASGIALATALLFVAHPVQTQAVTYIFQRVTSLATLFYLLSLLLYLKWRLASEESRRRSLYYAGALLSTVLAMKSKEITFTLPFMLLLIEAVFFGPLDRKQWIALIPFLLTLPIIPLSHPGSIGEDEAGFAQQTTEISRMDYLFTQFRVALTYFRLLIFPVHQNLDYDYPISHSLLEPKVLFSSLFLSVLLGLALYLLVFSQRSTPSQQLKFIGFGLLWFFLTLSIESSIIPIRDVIFEHRLYLPSIGFLLAGSALISVLLERCRGVSIVVIGVLVVISSVATYQRNMVWKDELTLWSDGIQKSPHKARGHVMMGVAYQNLGRLDEAVQEYKTALTLNPDYVEAHYYLGNIYKNLGHLENAIQEYKAALTLNPQYAKAYSSLGFIYLEQGRVTDALAAFKGRLN